MNSAHLVLIFLIGTAAYTDLKECRIPNWLTVSGVAAGLLDAFLGRGGTGLAASMTGCAAGFGMMLLLHVFGALGAGDVKLFAAIGAVGGTGFVYTAAVYSILAAGLIGLVILAAKGLLRQKSQEIGFRLFGFLQLHRTELITGMARSKEGLRFPFLLAVVPGTAAAACVLWF